MKQYRIYIVNIFQSEISQVFLNKDSICFIDVTLQQPEKLQIIFSITFYKLRDLFKKKIQFGSGMIKTITTKYTNKSISFLCRTIQSSTRTKFTFRTSTSVISESGEIPQRSSITQTSKGRTNMNKY